MEGGLRPIQPKISNFTQVTVRGSCNIKNGTEARCKAECRWDNPFRPGVAHEDIVEDEVDLTYLGRRGGGEVS